MAAIGWGGQNEGMKAGAISSDGDRVLGWDVLRGFCAFAVLGYHVLSWQNVAEIHTLGTYGVYIFFVLSGASLAYAYGSTIEAKRFSMRDFLLVRYARLAPLYLLLMVVVLPWKVLQGGVSLELVIRTLANAAFVFGFYNPASNSMLIGGWSLGIEAIFYLAFPLLFMLARAGRGFLLVVFAVVVQFAWIALVFNAPGGYGANIELYHQVPAFLAYFVSGVVLGASRRGGVKRSLHAGVGLVVLAGGFVVLALLNPAEAGAQLTGARGALLFSLCVFLVWISGAIRFESPVARRAAGMLGDATYGLYLIHPVVFFGLTYAVFPRVGVTAPAEWPLTGRLLFAAAMAVASFVLATASERYIERPVRQKVRKRLSPRPEPALAPGSCQFASSR